MPETKKNEATDSRIEAAKKRAKNKVSFIRHFISYVIVIIILAIINNVTSSQNQWWLWVALIWGIFVLINFVKAFIFQGGSLKKLEEDLIRKEVERMGAPKDEK
jgi:uncharacterized membrane protein YcjF (UPF0283 family)